MASYIKKIKLDTTTYEIRDSSAVHSGDTNANISITGSAESANTANSATTAETADVATKLGTTVVGGSNQPIYLNNGVPTAIGYTIADNVPSGAKFTDTVYTHPTYESKANGLYKITVDGIGHVSEAVAVTKDDIATLTFRPTGNSYLTFSSPNSFTLAVGDATKHWDGTLEYFASDKTWTVWDGTTTLSAVENDGEHVLYLRGIGNTKIGYFDEGGGVVPWVIDGTNVRCDGNIETLLDYATVEAGQHPTMAEKCFTAMFIGCTALITPPELPATTLVSQCYFGMFVGCTSLTQAPALPATTLAGACYASMFVGCTSLTQAPALPATTLVSQCYYGMFRGCASLTQAPALPATTLASNCYASMFESCTSLTQAPALPATTLAQNCYEAMFQGCTSLINAPALPATTLAEGCYSSMFYGCTSLTQVPALPATTLEGYCYQSMFQGCTSLTQAPALPATTLAQNCYEAMFQGCTSLTQAPALSATTLADWCYNAMFQGCASLKLSSTQTDEYMQEYRIPSSGTGKTATKALTTMFASTGGTFTGTPAINTTYYLSSDNMIVRETEVATLNGYVGAIAAPYSHISDETVHVTAEEKSIWNAKADAPFKPEGRSYLTFSSPNNFTLAVGDATKHWDGTLEYFASDKTWTVWDGTTTLSAVDNDGEHVLYLRGIGNTKIGYFDENGGVVPWVIDGTNVQCDGNIENLLDYATVEVGQHPTMAEKCFGGLFVGCVALITPPELPATTLVSQCYYGMFVGCTSLTHAPALPATTLAEACYDSMFYECASLTRAPALPATTLAAGCYSSMFFGCTSLTHAPALPATTLADWCYSSMFFGCTSLTHAPALPATTLASNCYQHMFNDCTGLAQAPALPATTLTDKCYYSMFTSCTSLTHAPALPATTLAAACYEQMFIGCTSLTQAPALPATTLADGCYKQMFAGCTSLTHAPALPATTLTSLCYYSMFHDCTSLTHAPALPATTLADACYYSMFKNCASLKLSSTQTDEYTQEYRIPSSGTGTTAREALDYMLMSTGGTFTGTPAINTTYYLSSDNMIVRETEIATLNGYVGVVIDTSVDSTLSSTSTNPVQNKVINTKLDSMQSDIDSKVPSSRTVNGKALTTDITLSASDVGALPNTTQIPSINGLATETYVDNKVAGLVGSIPVVVVSSSQPSGQKSGDLWYKIV